MCVRCPTQPKRATAQAARVAAEPRLRWSKRGTPQNIYLAMFQAHISKTKGMTSIEVAIIVAIVLVIAIAVGWYLYTTFAATGQQSGLIVKQAKVYSDGKIELEVVPQGAGQVEIVSVEVAGQPATCNAGVVSGPTTVTCQASAQLAVGQVVSSRIVLANGAVALFSATVQPAETGGGQ